MYRVSPAVKRCALGVIVAATAVFQGCSSVDPRRSFHDVQGTIEQRTGQRVEWISGAEEERAVAERVRKMLGRELSVDDAVAIALVNNPSIQATLEDAGIAEADLVQAGLLKNPVFSIDVQFPGRPHVRVDAGLEEEFADLLLLPLRKKTAAARFAQVKAEVIHAILRKGAEVRAAYYKLEGDEQLLELERQVVAANEAAAATSKALADAGNIYVLDHNNDLAVAQQAKLDLAATEADAADHREDLAALMGLRDSEYRVPGRLPELPAEEIDARELETLAMQRRFDLVALRQEAEVAGRALGYANIEALLNGGNVGVAYTRDPDVKSTIGPSLSVPLPIFDQGQAAVARAQAQLRQAKDRYQAMVIEVRSEVRKARNRVVVERKRAAFYKQTLIPLRETIVQQTQLQENAMFTSVFALLQAKEAEISAGRGYVETLRDYWLARARLEEAVAGPLPTIAATATTATTAPAVPTTAPATKMPAMENMHGMPHQRGDK